jgi:chorismate mutase/prephenate dehydratase
MSDANAPSNELSALREEVDRLNRSLERLLQERASVVLKIASVKQQRNLDALDLDREAQMFAALGRFSDGPLPREDVVSIFREILTASRKLQERAMRESPKD